MALTQVKSDGIATGAVTADQIATGAVTANDLEDSGVTAGTYGSSSAIPAITVDAKGRITSASTNSVTQVGGANGVDFNDNVKARFGTSNDLEIYHNGNDSVISDLGTGNLYIKASNNLLLRSAANEDYLDCTANGAVRLYHDNSAKLATTSTGINVTGSVTCDGLESDGTANIRGSTPQLILTDTDSTGTATQGSIVLRDSGGSNKYHIGDTSGANENFEIRNYATADIKLSTNNGGKEISLTSAGHWVPGDNNAQDLGTSSGRWRNIYTNDLNLSNEGGSNDVDGTWGSWTIQEGEDDLFLLNRRNGKKYKFNLTEVN